MPVYLYQCKKCKRELEINQSIKEDPITHSKHIKFSGRGETCNGRLKRLISPCSFVLRGGGWTGRSY